MVQYRIKAIKMARFKKFILPLVGVLWSTAFAATTPPITTVQGIVDLFNKILFWVSTVFWIAAGIATLYAGFLYMTASGDEQRVTKAKKQLLYAVIAIAIGIIAAGLPALICNFLKAGSGTC